MSAVDDCGLRPSDLTAIYNCSAFFAYAFSVPLLKEPFRRDKTAAVLVAIAGVLTTAPEILILDEPTTFLDPPGHRELTRILASLSQARIIVTHDVPFARALTRRAVFFEKGRISADGPLEEIVQRFRWDAGV